ncbi:hypothetical protein KWG64_17240 [Rahnella sp. PD12R]|uniref:hypothetical protein n=1 Tax=Rahnella sp. PD12R TaxID=2855688 RepID=UPI001C475D56|nr:hypothetical protein [Rahnella sp. PD12R]MBV6819690.1 hypothetical protein [Rahnella sp. PD12R]
MSDRTSGGFSLAVIVKVKTLGALSSKPWVATQTGFKGRLSPHPLKIPGSLTARYRWLAMFQLPPLLPRKLAAARFPFSVSSHRSRNASFGKLSESGWRQSKSASFCELLVCSSPCEGEGREGVLQTTHL